MVYQVIYLQHNAPERVVGYITGNSPRHALAMARHSPKYGDYDPDRLTVAEAPPKKPGQAPQRKAPMQPEQMLLKLARELLAMDFPTQDAMDKYLKEHPDADRSNHKVVKNDGETLDDVKKKLYKMNTTWDDDNEPPEREAELSRLKKKFTELGGR